jgi:hypothetical protein
LKNTLSFAFHQSAGRQGEKVFIFRCVGDCGGSRRFLHGFHLTTFTYPPALLYYGRNGKTIFAKHFFILFKLWSLKKISRSAQKKFEKNCLLLLKNKKPFSKLPMFNLEILDFRKIFQEKFRA